MTISSTDDPRAGPFDGNGSQTAFPFEFKTFSKNDLLVIRTDDDGIEYVLVLDSDFSAALNADQDNDPGGTVTYPISGAALPVGETLTIASDLDFTQTTDITSGSGFYPQVIENALDRNVMLIKQVNSAVGRALQVAVSTPDDVDVTLPSPSADKIIGWNDTATGLVNRDITDFATVVAFAAWQSQLFDGTGAQTIFTLSSDPGNINNLDIAIGGVTQYPAVDFTLSGTTLTFLTAPPAGTDNIFVRWGQALPQGDVDEEALEYLTPISTTLRGMADKLREDISVTDWPGVVADKVTDNTTAILALWTALGATYDGRIYIPYGCKFNSMTVYAAAPIRAYIVDDSARNSWDTAGGRARVVGIAEAGDATAVVDLTYRVSSGHNAGIALDNTGACASTSGTKGIGSLLWTRGQLSKDPGREGLRQLSRAEWAKIDGVNQWGYFIRKFAPWLAQRWEYWLPNTVWAAGSYILNISGKFYMTVAGGTSSTVEPSHASGSAVDGTVTWVFVRAAHDQTIFMLNENGELATNTSPVAAVVAYFKASVDSDGAAIIISEATGVSKRAELRLSYTDAAGTVTQAPRLRAEDGVGLRLVDSVVSKTLFSATDANGLKIGQHGWTESLLTASGATPSVANAGMLILANVGATSITGFTNAADNQEIELFFENGNTTLTHNASTFVLKGGVNVTPAANAIIVMRKYSRSSAWFEKSRNF